MADGSFDMALIFNDGDCEYKSRVANDLDSMGIGLSIMLRDVPRPEQVLAEALVALGDRHELCSLPETRTAMESFVVSAMALLDGYRKVDERVAKVFPRLHFTRLNETA